MLKDGKIAPPIELAENHISDNRSGRLYDICNGFHRYQAAVNTGRTTILAVIVAAQYEHETHWFSYRRCDGKVWR
jgi:hypothetical protein